MALSEMWTLMLRLPARAMSSPVDLFRQVLRLSLTPVEGRVDLDRVIVVLPVRVGVKAG